MRYQSDTIRNPSPLLLVLTCLGALALSFMATVASAQAGGRPSKTEIALMQLEHDIGEANIRRDKAFFGRVEADECIFTDSAGGLTTKAEDLASLDKPAGETKLMGYVADDMTVKVYGSTAVVWGRTTTTYHGPKGEIVARSRFTDVFVKRAGRWRIVAGHSSRIREPQK